VPWRRGIVVIASAYITEESRVRIPPGCKLFRNIYIAELLSQFKMPCHCVYLRKNKCLKISFC
jgi:hypothetical protein